MNEQNKPQILSPKAIKSNYSKFQEHRQQLISKILTKPSNLTPDSKFDEVDLKSTSNAGIHSPLSPVSTADPFSTQNLMKTLKSPPSSARKSLSLLGSDMEDALEFCSGTFGGDNDIKIGPCSDRPGGVLISDGEMAESTKGKNNFVDINLKGDKFIDCAAENFLDSLTSNLFSILNHKKFCKI